MVRVDELTVDDAADRAVKSVDDLVVVVGNVLGLAMMDIDVLVIE
jgi:ribosomal protein L18E